MDLTKDSEKLLNCAYKMYLERRKQSNPNAKCFDSDFYLSDKELSETCDEYVQDALIELHKAKYIQLDLIGEFELTTTGICYCENKNKVIGKSVGDTVEKIVDVASKLLPFIG